VRQAGFYLKKKNFQSQVPLTPPSCGALKLVGINRGNGGAAPGLVADPVERIQGGVATVAAQAALVLQAAPAAVGVPRPQALVAVRVLRAVLHAHLAQLPVGHHVHVVLLQVEQQVRPH
jgi:hypothetical protein